MNTSSLTITVPKNVKQYKLLTPITNGNVVCFPRQQQSDGTFGPQPPPWYIKPPNTKNKFGSPTPLYRFRKKKNLK